MVEGLKFDFPGTEIKAHVLRRIEEARAKALELGPLPLHGGRNWNSYDDEADMLQHLADRIIDTETYRFTPEDMMDLGMVPYLYWP
jgi:hypothetical protein